MNSWNDNGIGAALWVWEVWLDFFFLRAFLSNTTILSFFEFPFHHLSFF